MPQYIFRHFRLFPQYRGNAEKSPFLVFLAPAPRRKKISGNCLVCFKDYCPCFQKTPSEILPGIPLPGLCSTHESWVKFDSTLTQMSRVRVESTVKIQDMSRVRVESLWLSFESELSQLDTAWVKVKALIFRRENVKILKLSVTLQRKNQPTATFDRTLPPPGQQLFPN